jgi:hypothetical protein
VSSRVVSRWLARSMDDGANPVAGLSSCELRNLVAHGKKREPKAGDEPESPREFVERKMRGPTRRSRTTASASAGGRLLALACLSVAIGAAAAARGDAAPASTGALVLRPADVGKGFSVRSRETGRRATAEAPISRPRGLLERLARWGKIGGCQVDLVRRLSAAALQEGPLEVVSSASVYRTGSGARAAFAYARRSLVPAAYAPLPLGFRLGQEARQYVRGGPSAVGTLLVYLVVWRQRNVNASLVIVGRVGVVSAFDVAPLARRQEAHIRARLRSVTRAR